MAESLLIHFNPASEQQSWALLNDAGELTTMLESGPLSQAAERATGRRCLVLLDNNVLHINQLQMPAMNQQRLLRAIPYAMEELLADDIEDMHFVFHRADKTGPVTVVAIERGTLQAVLDQLAECGITASAILPECLCLAGSDTQWSLLLQAQQARLQYGSYIGNEYDSDVIDTVLAAQLRNCDQAPQKLLVFCTDDMTPPDFSDILGDTTQQVNISYNQHPLVVYCGNVRQAMPLNLLQHAYKPVSSGGIAWRRWSVAAALGLLWLGSSMGYSWWQLQQLKATNAALNADAIRIYRQAFPDSKRIVNPRVQMEQKLKELRSGNQGGGSSVVSLMARSAPALDQQTSIKLRSLSYRNGRLDITVDSDNLSSLQALNKRLNASGELQSEIISSSSQKDTVTGSLRIQQAKT